MGSDLPLRRVSVGVYETPDGECRVVRCHLNDARTGRTREKVARVVGGSWSFTGQLAEATLPDAQATLETHLRTERPRTLHDPVRYVTADARTCRQTRAHEWAVR
jgi:hypothetical protein